MARAYRNLRFAKGVDWQDVRPELLQKLNRLGMLAGKTITIFSGYRSDKKSAAVGGFAGDPHTRHIAVDATVDGKPVGSVIPLKLFAKVGLESGNQPNFYNGKPDPSHVQLEAGGSTPNTQGTPGNKTKQQSASQPYVGGGEIPPGAPGQPEDTVPGVYAPGSGTDTGFNGQSLTSMWQLLASQPLSSPESQSFLKKAQLADPGTG